MPTAIIRVAKVLPRTVGSSFQPLTKYDVIPALVPGELASPIYGTFDQFAAALCQRAADLDVPVRLLWKDSRFGRELVDCALLQQEVA